MELVKQYWPLALFVAVFVVVINLALGAAGVESAVIRALGMAVACFLGIVVFNRWGAKLSG
jgi:F0F1-type ATP synthase membrane subunit a